MQMPNLHLGALLSGSLNSTASHPVTLPKVIIKYEQKDITSDIQPYLLSVSYTDYLEGQSDEVQVELEDVDGRWRQKWYPEQGDKISLEIGDQINGMLKLGSMELAEIEYQHPPSVITLKALSTGITKSNRTQRGRAYEHTTLADIVRRIARRLHLKVTGTIRHIPIERVTQYQERDVEFLTRLAKEYGHTFKIVGRQLVFQANDALAEQKPVAVLLPEDIKNFRLRDLIKGVPQEAVVSGYDAKRKTTRRTRRRSKALRLGGKRASSGDTLKIVANRGESQAQVNARADAALNDAQQSQVAGNISLVGNAKLVAGQTVQLKGFGKFSGKYLVKQARHEIRRGGGFTTDLEVKMVEYVPDEPPQPAAATQPKKQAAKNANP